MARKHCQLAVLLFVSKETIKLLTLGILSHTNLHILSFFPFS